MPETVSVLKVRVVGYYTVPEAETTDCICCHDADWADVLIEGICGRCLLEAYHEREKQCVEASA
jgi:hypothetical protein